MTKGTISNLKPVRNTEEARERGAKGGIASGEARRAKRSMKETAQALLAMPVAGDNIRSVLSSLGIEDNDKNYQTAMIARLILKATQDGDAQSIRLLGEMVGELTRSGFGFGGDVDEEIAQIVYPVINLPNNGRDKIKRDELSPQAGPQTMFMSCPADIIIYGGAAGGGKTYALLLEGLRHKDVKGFSGVIFRHNYTQITASGGLWDASQKIYSQVEGAAPFKTPKLHWKFGTDKGRLNFAHLEKENDLISWMGTEICYLGFDELTHFTRRQFLYMLSRNRTTCGVKPYVRATCNPDAESWVADFISWWIDQETGYPIPERSGIVRYMCVQDDEIHWGATRKELADKFFIAEDDCKSVTFIASKLEDNKVLMESDPGYMANLKAMTQVDRERLLEGNWKIKPCSGMYFKRGYFEIVNAIPHNVVSWVRSWDLAATEPTPENPSPDATAGVLMGRLDDGRYIIADVRREQSKANAVRMLVKNTAVLDQMRYKFVNVTVPQDPGQAGKEQAESYIKLLSGFAVSKMTPSGSKELRATPFASQVQAGNVLLLEGDWNEMYLSELEAFPESAHDDMVDASSDAFNKLQATKDWGGLIS